MPGALREIITYFGLDVDKGSFKSADAKVGQLRKGIVTLARALAGGVVVNELRKMVNETVALGDSIDKTSGKIGISTDALQELRYAGELSGVATNTVDMALQRFTRRTAEAARGTGEAKDALAEMGIRLRGNDGRLRSADELLGDVAEKMGKVKSGGDRVRLAMKLFDSEGVSFVNMLKDGRAGLDEMRAEAHALGGVLDQELIANTVIFTDEQTRLGYALRGVKNDIVRGLLPGLIQSVRATIEWVKANREAISDKVVRLLKVFTGILSGLGSIIWAVVNGLDSMGDSLGPLGSRIAILVGLFGLLALAMGLPIAVAAAVVVAIQDLKTYFEGGNSVFGLIVDSLLADPISEDDWWFTKLLKQALYLMDEIQQRPKETFKDIAEWLGFEVSRFKDAGAAGELEQSAKAGAANAPVPLAYGGKGGSSAEMSSNVTVNQTINAQPGQSPAEIGEAAARSTISAIAAEHRRAIRALVPQPAGS